MRIDTITRRIAAVLLGGLLSFVAGDAVAASAAGFTTTGTGEDAHCKNGNPEVNCNIYDGKQYVWMNGGPVFAALGNGKFIYVVLAPSGQNNPNDGGANNLSDDFDAYTVRTFTILNGVITNPGGHVFDAGANKIQLANFADTTNSGGVYIMAVCSIGPTGSAYPVKPKECKYDAFKIEEGAACTPGVDCPCIPDVDCPCPPGDPTCVVPTPRPKVGVFKSATGASDEKWTWTITKTVTTPALVKLNSGTATFGYNVALGNDDGVVTTEVSGTITVNVTNGPVNGTLSDSIGLVGASCTIKDAADTVVSGPTSFDTGLSLYTYVCTSSSSPPSAAATNVATVAWTDDTAAEYNDPNPNKTSAGQVDFSYTITETDECVAVTDKFNNGTPASLNGALCTPGSFTPAQTVPVPAFDCVTYPNVATFVTNDTGASGSSPQSVTVCGPEKTGGLTMGFWQNKNGQDIIGASKVGTCALATWLRTFAPFQDLSATATCAQVQTYVTNVIKSASAAGATMNPMLKGQMLATALDVYFSSTSLGGNKIGAPGPIGSAPIDLTKVCKNIAACTIYENTSGAFGNATSMTVMQLLTYAASQSNAGGSVWYAAYIPVKTTQELAKDTFDAINNQKAFAP